MVKEQKGGMAAYDSGSNRVEKTVPNKYTDVPVPTDYVVTDALMAYFSATVVKDRRVYWSPIVNGNLHLTLAGSYTEDDVDKVKAEVEAIVASRK